MRAIFQKGDIKTYLKKVSADDLAAFHGELVHPVCSTFALARDIEWTTRQFVLEMRDDDEDGIGTFVTIEHKGAAFEGETILFTGSVDSLQNHELICSVEARVGARLIASAKTGQKILKREKLKLLFQPQ
jgi:fluoroacetyl-CoA thioesterase